MMRISFDLDNTIFDLSVLYHKACEKYNVKYVHPIDWDVYKCYPKEVGDELKRLFKSDEVYQTPLLDVKIPYILNDLYAHPNFDVYYITERSNADKTKDQKQLSDAGIVCDDLHVVDWTPKIEALKKHRIDLHFDDSPNVIKNCLENNIDCIIISNDNTPYNHQLRKYVKYYPTLIKALQSRSLIR